MNKLSHSYEQCVKEEWLEEIMDEYGECLTKFAYNYLKDWDMAQDVVQDVFIICFKHYEKTIEINSFKAWIYRITINKCKDIIKSSVIKKLIYNIDLFNVLKAKELSPEVNIVRKNEEEYLANCVLSLPVKYREVIILYYYEHFSIGDISKILKLKKNTIKTRLNRARIKLKSEMERGGYNGE